MPGYSSECMSGAHTACIDRDCRCEHHPWTQELLRKKPIKGDKRGGIRRRGKGVDAPLVIPKPGEDFVIEAEAPVTELRNTCPQCGGRARPTDSFCRRDGTKLLQGKQCLGCSAPAEPDDTFCWQCGLKIGEKPPEPVVEAQAPQEDPILRLQRQAREQGLLKDVVVS